MPERGDVVVFRLPRDPSQTYVKRAVGLPGDRVQMRAGRLWVNGRMLPLRRDGIGAIEADDGTREPAPRFVETLPNGREHPIFKYRPNGELDDTQQFLVGAGQIFVMGDNRDDSLDSRVPGTAFGVGFVPVENLVGTGRGGPRIVGCGRAPRTVVDVALRPAAEPVFLRRAVEGSLTQGLMETMPRQPNTATK